MSGRGCSGVLSGGSGRSDAGARASGRLKSAGVNERSARVRRRSRALALVPRQRCATLGHVRVSAWRHSPMSSSTIVTSSKERRTNERAGLIDDNRTAAMSTSVSNHPISTHLYSPTPSPPPCISLTPTPDRSKTLHAPPHPLAQGRPPSQRPLHPRHRAPRSPLRRRPRLTPTRLLLPPRNHRKNHLRHHPARALVPAENLPPDRAPAHQRAVLAAGEPLREEVPHQRGGAEAREQPGALRSLDGGD